MENKIKIFTCCICCRQVQGEFGHNPWPVKEEGECCDKCNMHYVIPARIKRLK